MRTRFASTFCFCALFFHLFILMKTPTLFVVSNCTAWTLNPKHLNPQHGPPKEKHVQTLLGALNNGNPPKEVFSELIPRLQSSPCTHTHTHTHTCTCAYIHMYTYTCAYIHKYTYLCAYIHMYTHIGSYIHMCLHTYIQKGLQRACTTAAEQGRDDSAQGTLTRLSSLQGFRV